jgi:hypothetical protein
MKRQLLQLVAGVSLSCWWEWSATAAAPPPSSPPADNRGVAIGFAWIDEIKWANGVDITQMPGNEMMENINSAQQQLVAKGGGVVYFSPRTYQVKDHCAIASSCAARTRRL